MQICCKAESDRTIPSLRSQMETKWKKEDLSRTGTSPVPVQSMEVKKQELRSQVERIGQENTQTDVQ